MQNNYYKTMVGMVAQLGGCSTDQVKNTGGPE